MRDKIVRKISKEQICGIYSVTNKINKKIYIGQSIDIERRWNQHKYGKGNIILRNAIRKYGLENFTFQIIEQILTSNRSRIEIIQMLTEAEQRWFDSKEPYIRVNGYNIQKTAKPNLTPNRDKNFGDKISQIKIDNNHCGKPVVQYTLDGDQIKLWKSAAEINRVLGFNAENISASCLGKYKTSNGFIWRFKGILLTKKEISDSKIKLRNKKSVGQYTIDGKLINVYESMSKAADSVDCPAYQISKVCTGKQKSCRNYIWAFIL